MKKFFALVLAIMMVMSLAVPAAADDIASVATEYTIKITNADLVNGKDHTYEAYQLFAGDLHNAILSNISWGEGVNVWKTVDGVKTLDTAVQTQILADLKSDSKIGTIMAGAVDASTVAAVMAGESFKADIENLDAFAEIMNNYLATPAATVSTGVVDGGQVTYTMTIPAEKDGYYLIKDKNGTQDAFDNNGNIIHEGSDYTKLIVQVVGNVTIEHKSSVPTVSKKVSNSTALFEDDEITAALNQSYYYELIGTLPSEFDYYDEYFYEFQDTLSTGIDFIQIKEVYAYHDGYAGMKFNIDPSEYTALTNGKQLTVTFQNLKDPLTGTYVNSANETVTAEVALNNRHRIVVVYEAALNSHSVIAGEGNKNEVRLEYSNNPSGTSHGVTVPDHTHTYTFKAQLIKKDGGDETGKTLLNGAKFVLYRLDASSQPEYAILDSGYKLLSWTSDKTAATPLITAGEGENAGRFVITGLAATTYYLEEIQAPAGYNLPAPDKRTTEFTIHMTTKEDHNVGTLTVSVKNAVEPGSDVANGTVSMVAQNFQGSTLPSTGGMGTTLFYVFGSIMVLGALVLLVTKKRMAAEN